MKIILRKSKTVLKKIREKTWNGRIMSWTAIIITLISIFISELSFIDCPGWGIFTKSTTCNNMSGEFFGPNKTQEDSLFLYAMSAALIDGETGRLLYGKKAEVKMPMASTTKIMTLLVTLEQGNLKDTVRFSKYAASMPDVQLNAKEGDEFVLEDLCYALMLESYNDVAAAIAEHVGGSVEGFAELMNKKAEALGLKNTHFVTPNGLDSEGHYTTAWDLAVLASHALKNKDFINITNTKSHYFKEINGKGSYTVNNKNAFLNMYPGAIGVKTGFTGKAGYCFVGAARQDDRLLVSAVLASGWPPDKTKKWKDTKTLMDYGFKNFHTRISGVKNPRLPELTVEDGIKDSVALVSDAEPVKILLKDGERVIVEYRLMKSIKAPVEKGKIVGSISYRLGDKVLSSYSVYTTERVEKRNMVFWIKKILAFFLFIL